MGRFRYVALDAGGEEIRGLLEGPSIAWVSERLHGQELVPLEILDEEEAGGAGGWLGQLLPIGVEDLSLFCSQFAMMIDSGVPILTALELLSENATKQKLKDLLDDAVGRIREGNSLHVALQESGVFPEIAINMIRAGEISGTLVESLSQLAEYLERESQLKGKVRNAMLYPAFLLLLSVAVVTFLMVAIIPKFTQVLDNLGVPLPWPTRVLIQISHGLVHGWPWILLGLAAAGAGVYLALREESIRRRLDTLLTRLPLLGEVVVKNALARFSYVLGSLLAGGIDMVQALETAERSTGNRSLGRAVAQARRDLVGGSSVSEALANTGEFPALLLQMVGIGEATGKLDQLLLKLASLYDQQVDRVTRGLISLMEPALILVLGFVVGFIALSMVLPMIKAVASLGA